MKDFRSLKVRDMAHRLTLDIYRVTANFPKEELFGLTSQTRRASSSIPANIAEGCGRNSDADFCRFLTIAMGSASELKYQLLLAKDLGFINEIYERLETEIVEVKRMLTALIQKLKADR